MGLLSLVILVVPLLCLVFATIHLLNSYEFIELLAAQTRSPEGGTFWPASIAEWQEP